MRKHKNRQSGAIDFSVWPSRQTWSPYPAPHALERQLLKMLLVSMGSPPVEFVLWNGDVVTVQDSPPVGRLHLRNRRSLWQIVANPELHFGDAYSRGDLEIEGNLVAVLEAVYRAISSVRDRPAWLGRVNRWRNRARRNTLTGSRENIHQHYNLGNEFFRQWLDEGMVYTCAYFPSPEMTLEQAQRAKMDHVCRKLRLQPGETVVEAGCGWGALACHMAKHYGVKVRAFNISHEQIMYARERVSGEGLDGRVEVVEDDYRNMTGTYDVFVSVGMLEHVGRDNYRGLGEVIHRCLAPEGRGLIHSIGRDQPCPMNAWIERRIFPGSYPPTLREMMEVLEPWSFSVLDVENLRMHYARTLEHWLVRYEDCADKVRQLYGPEFVRAWRLYLAGSLAGFSTGWLQLFQLTFARTGTNPLPWTREHIYHHSKGPAWTDVMP